MRLLRLFVGARAARAFTMDDASGMTKVRYYTTEPLGPKQSLTPEGFLLCQDVPIARTGDQIYGPHETPIPAGGGGYVTITRDADEVFRSEFMRSFEGKPVTIDHPREEVTPENWKRYAVGTVSNVRRGTGDLANFLVADLLITDAAAIAVVRDGKREVSCGYDAEYEETGPGKGRQYAMVGNHLALVDAARCGSRCSIQDKKPLGDELMRATTKDNAAVTVPAADALAATRKPWLDRIVTAVVEMFKTKGQTVDAATIEPMVKKVLDDMPFSLTMGARDEEAHGKIAALEARCNGMDARHKGHDERFEKLEGPKEPTGDNKEIEGALKEEAPAGTQDKAAVATDSAYLSDAHQEVVAGAEILHPGMKVDAFDKAAKPKTTLDSICRMRRTALGLALATTDGAPFIKGLNGGRDVALDAMSCSDVRSLFRSAIAARKQIKDSNDRAAADRAAAEAAATAAAKGKTGAPRSIAEFNRRNREKFDGKAQ